VALDEQRRLQEENKKMKQDSVKDSAAVEKSNEVRERAHMTQEELVMFRSCKKKEITKLEGQVAELKSLQARPGVLGTPSSNSTAN